MMTVYKISQAPEEYMSFSISAEELTQKMGGRFKARFNGKPQLENWTQPNAYFYSDEGCTKIPDITCWAIGNLVLNQKAFDILGDTIAQYGEFLPTNCEGIPYYIYNSLSIIDDSAVDASKSEQDIDLGVFMGVKSLGFHDDKASEHILFKTNFDKKVSLFCNDRFKNLIMENSLHGLSFETELV